MKRILCTLLIASLCVPMAGCGALSGLLAPKGAATPTPLAATASIGETGATAAPVTTVAPTPEPATASPSPTPEPTPTPTHTPEPTPEPEPTPAPFQPDTPDNAGENGILFNIYQTRALADLNVDGVPEEIVFEAGNAAATLTINGTGHAVALGGLAQRFAITDVNMADKHLEIVLTQKHDAGLADSEKAFSYLYWWDGAELLPMGGLMDVKFDGAWRTGFQAVDHINGAGQLTCLARSTEFTDIWYMAHYKPDGSARKLKEAPYSVKPVNKHDVLTVKTSCLLLKKIDSNYFKSGYYVMYDPASWPHAGERVPNPANDDYTVIAQKNEELTIVAVYGQYWFKLKTADGYQGWIKVIDHKMQGYWQVMHWTVQDIFSGIVVAG